MGRNKKYVTRNQIRNKNRDKSTRYYYNHRNDILKKKREEIKETEFNDWIDPEKVTLSFIWFCFSKLNKEKIESNLSDYREKFGDTLRKHFIRKRKEQLQLNTNDEEMTNKIETEIEDEVIKNKDRMMDDLIRQMNLTKDDWKKTLGLDKMNKPNNGVE